MVLHEIFGVFVYPGMALLFGLAFLYEWIDRKFFARVQNRIGPLYTGPSGILQPVADFLKLLSKEDIVPESCEKPIFSVIPIVYATLPLIALFVIPITGSALISFEGDIIFLMFISALITLSVFLAGWSSAGSFSRIGSIRSALQMLSYEIPFGLALIGPAISAHSLSLTKIAQWQAANSSWFLWLQPIGFAVVLISLLAELELVPFDIPEAETEIVAGWLTEYGGRRLALFRLGKDLELVMASTLVASLYLGGAQPLFFIPPVLILIIKSVVVLLLISFVRALFARFRIDQMTSGMWTYLLPLMIVQILLVQLGIGG
ncbi:MAG: complex I subunit 1 family protein [Candidatus Methanomethylicaceae archaeon]|nr:NADH-quinone oxidoreductase subunit H [Candidatus Verstraetearchaeota archaeon]